MTRRRREYLYGVKASVMARQTARDIAKLRDLVETISGRWGEVFGGVVFDCDELIDKITALEATVAEAVDYLKEVDDGD
jgi:hypothetical protein